MRKKSEIDFEGSSELSRLLTQRRLQRAGVKLAKPSSDPDLAELVERVRSATLKKHKAPAVPFDIVKKLAGG